MKISYNWLKKFLPKHYNYSPQSLSDLLTDIGLEVEGLEEKESVKGGLKGVVIGHVEDIWQHPNADRLKCTKVNIGTGETLSIVCGAKNVDKGQKVIVATVGSELHFANGESLIIKKSKLRGEVSEGMICAEDEIGMGQSHDGIMVLPKDTKIGIPAAEYFKIESDFIFEIGLTPNRADAMSHFGVARDIVAAKNVRENKNDCIQNPFENKIESTFTSPIKIDVKANQRSPRYAGVVIKNLIVEESPAWLKNALLSIGITPKNNLVDVTNYVLHSIGQPLHAFDTDAIKGNTVVVNDGHKSKFTTLDGQERQLHPDDLIIGNTEAPMCIAGVFGGLNSGVKATTKSIFLESAYFNPVSIRKTAKRQALNTDASYRFERGIDPEITIAALHYAIALIKDLCPNAEISDVLDVNNISEKTFEFNFSPSKANELIGLNLTHEEIQQCLTALDIKTKVNGDNWQIAVPTYRVDVQRQADIAEEILRLKGFNSVEIPAKISLSVADLPRVNKDNMLLAISKSLVANGFNEAINNSLTAEKHEQLFSFNSDKAVKMLNPLSQDLDVMRQNLLGGLLKNVQHNANRQRKNLRLFEFGRAYLKSETYIETEHLTLLISGKVNDKHWSAAETDTSFYQLKHTLDNMLAMLLPKADFKLKEAKADEFDYAINYSLNKKSIATLGAVKSSALKKADISQDVFAANLDINNLFNLYKNYQIPRNDLPKFPEVRRDLSFLLDSDKSYAEVETVVKNAERKLLQEVGLFDLYEGKNLSDGKKSYAIYMIFRDDSKTLEDTQVEKAMARITDNLIKQLNIEIRK